MNPRFFSKFSVKYWAAYQEETLQLELQNLFLILKNSLVEIWKISLKTSDFFDYSADLHLEWNNLIDE